MTKFDLQKRTKKFHVDVIMLCAHFPKNAAGFETAKQLIRAAGSVGANYGAACRAKSNADFIYKLEIVLEEADELVSIFNAADITAKKNREANNPKIIKSQNQK